MKVNFLDLKKQYAYIMPTILDSIATVFNTSSYVGGKLLEQFEKEFAEFHKVKYCVGVGSGTDALWLTLLSYGIGKGDEVIVPANTYIATAFAVSHTGAKVVFVDADPFTYNMDINQLPGLITDKTKAIIPVHLYGNPCDVDRIKAIVGSRGIKIIEDCAQSCGARLRSALTGSLGDVGCFSFYPAKNLGGLGQGGAVITDDAAVVKMVRELGNVGRAEGSWFDYDYVGFNSRLDTINAAFLSAGLKELPKWNFRRNQVASAYNSNLRRWDYFKVPHETDDDLHIYHLYELKCNNKKDRDGLKEFLAQNEIGTGLHYPIPCHLQKPYVGHGRFPVAENLANTLISLPMHPNLNEEEILYVATKVIEFFTK
jgi:dTDP-4-amino-4,6-dideoxygalactose transaminase